MPSKKQETKTRTSRQQLIAMKKFLLKKSTLIAIAVFIILLFLIDIAGFGGNIRFYAKWIECGHKPVVAGGTYVGLVPHYEEAITIPGVRLSPRQFCSPREAEMQGFSANERDYDYPHLNLEENRWVRDEYLF